MSKGVNSSFEYIYCQKDENFIGRWSVSDDPRKKVFRIRIRNCTNKVCKVTKEGDVASGNDAVNAVYLMPYTAGVFQGSYEIVFENLHSDDPGRKDSFTFFCTELNFPIVIITDYYEL